jgi:hypothetical protein
MKLSANGHDPVSDRCLGIYIAGGGTTGRKESDAWILTIRIFNKPCTVLPSLILHPSTSYVRHYWEDQVFMSKTSTTPHLTAIRLEREATTRAKRRLRKIGLCESARCLAVTDYNIDSSVWADVRSDSICKILGATLVRKPTTFREMTVRL